MIKFQCPTYNCPTFIKAPKNLAGTKVECPGCRRMVKIPLNDTKNIDISDYKNNSTGGSDQQYGIEFSCPTYNCPTRIKVPINYTGDTKILCPGCQRIIKIPSEALDL